jgi:YD repeat-containing protein
MTDPLGHTTRTAYDSLDRITATTDPLGNQTAFSYDADGDLLTLTDANQHSTTYSYDSLDRPITRTDALGNQSTTQYDLSGNISQPIVVRSLIPLISATVSPERQIRSPAPSAAPLMDLTIYSRKPRHRDQ